MVKDSTAVDVPDLIGTMHPLCRENKTNYKSLKYHIQSLFKEKKAKRILFYLCLNALCTITLVCWCVSTNSIALAAYTSLTIFDFLSLMTILVTVWVKKQEHSSVYSFGYERFEVLWVFSTTLLAQLVSFFIIKESLERVVIEQPDIHTGRLMVGTIFTLIFHTSTTYGLHNPSFQHCIQASSSSWLQEHVSDMSESLCHIIPGLSKLLLPRLNPLSLVAVAGATALFITHLFVDLYGYHSMDTWAGMWIAVIIWATMFPISAYTGKILLQTTPSHLIGQLDKCLREASTLDGVLEFRNEHFWTVSFGRMAGSVHVRVRRDADEQMVLAHVFHRLSSLVSLLNVQIFKDNFSRTHTFHHTPISDFNPADKFSLTSTLPAYHPNAWNVTQSNSNLSPLVNSTSLVGYGLPVGGGGGVKVPTSLLPTVEMLSEHGHL